MAGAVTGIGSLPLTGIQDAIQCVAYGLVPTWLNLDKVNPESLFARWLSAASSAGDPQDLARRSMITATCGLGLLEAPSVPASFGLARGVGTRIRRLVAS